MMNTSADPLPLTYPVAGGNLGGSLHAVGGGGGTFEDHLMVNWWDVSGDIMGSMACGGFMGFVGTCVMTLRVISLG